MLNIKLEAKTPPLRIVTLNGIVVIAGSASGSMESMYSPGGTAAKETVAVCPPSLQFPSS